ncbi:hypothetical protein LSCM4_07623 [Leishmania orientalis]|uniref:Uncharacterized protein n=1 Tax=Leishmania orientalis TaxID=2249476 RepID=A0A836KS37_9TRYP|nr:hypothetical protein LSCM4_07623 [Leishmania orientalis]
MASRAASSEHHPSYAGVADPCAAPSPSSPRCANNGAAGVPATAMVTTVIHMTATEDDEENKAQGSADDGAGTDTARTAADAAAAEAHGRTRGTGAATAGEDDHTTLWADEVKTFTAYESTSAALRRLPARTAPAGKAVCKGQRSSDVKKSRAEASATRAGASALSSLPSAAPSGTVRGGVGQRAACTSNTPADAAMERKASAPVLTVVSPPSSRFQVPPPPSSQTARFPAVHAPPHTSLHRGEESVNGRPRAADQDRKDVTEVVGVHGDESDGSLEEDVAARVLFSLQQKDGMIDHLTRAVETLRDENTVLRSSCAAAAEANVAPPPSASGSAVSPDRVKISSPSWPATPVRWWKTEHDGSQGPERIGDAIVEKKPLQASSSLSAAHAAVSTIDALQRTLAEKEAELEGLRARVVTHGRAQVSRDVGAPPATPPVEHSSGDSLASDARGAPSASLSAAEAVAQARIAQLEWQLENVQQEKREDTHTLRDHIDHLTRELHRKSRDMARQQRQHKLELTALQQEVEALANQLEEQIRASACAAAGAPSRESEAEQAMELRRQLAQAKAREALLLSESAAAQQRWLRELKEQTSLLDEVRADAAQEEARNESRVQQQQQRHEAQVLRYQSALAHAQRELSELRAVHQRTEEMVSEQRQQLQLVSHDIAAAALERAHDEQRAARAEQQVALLHQQLRQAEATISSQEAELETLRQSRQDEAAASFALQEEEHAALLKRVEGCMKGSEAVESALLTAEQCKQEMASQLARALEERNEYHRLYREASVQAQAQLLEQQQLLSEGNDVLCRRLREAEQDLTHRTAALETTQRELRAMQQRMLTLEDELARSEAAQHQLGEELQAAQARHEAQTEQLVHAKESLKDALHAQLATMGKLRRKEQRLSSQQAAAQRAMERRQEEQRVLQGIADLLWPPAVPLLPTCVRASAVGSRDVSRVASLPPPQLLRSAAAVAPGGFPALSRSALLVLERGANISTRKSCRIVQRQCASRADALTAGGTDVGVDAEGGDVRSAVCPSRSASQVPSTAASVVMSAVSSADAPVASLDDGGVALEEQQLQVALSAQEGEGRTAATETDLPVLRLLRAIHDAVEQMCAAYTAAQHELGTKRAAVRTLVKERKAQQAQLEELRATLQEQQHRAERLRRDAAESARAEFQSKLEEAKRTWRERHEADMVFQQRSSSEQHRRAVGEVLKACAEYVQAEIIAFAQLLPTTLSVGLATAVAASAARAREEVLRHVHQEHWCSSSAPSAAHHFLWGHGYGAQAPHTSTAAGGAADESLLSWGLEVQPEVQAECDAIVRDVLGMAGGWADLKSAVLVASSTAAADNPAGGAPPSTALPPPQTCAFVYDPAVASSTAPPAAESAWRLLVSAEAAGLSAEEVAELKEVIHAHLTRSFSALKAVASLSSLAGVAASVSEHRACEERQDVDGDAPRASSSLKGASGSIQSTTAKGMTAGGESTAALRVTALPRWMRSRGAFIHQASPLLPFSGTRETVGKSTPPKRTAVEEAATAPVPLHHEQPRLLALLLDACVAQVLERLIA